MNEERDMMIERYLDGSMTAPERSAFLQAMESNAELRRSVAAEQLIRNAVQGDRAAHARPPANSRDRFLAMLAGVSAELQNAPAPEATQTVQHAGAQNGTAASGSLKALPWIGGGLAVILSAVLILPTLFDPNEAPVGTPSTVSAPAVSKPAAQVPSVPAPDAAQTNPAPIEEGLATRGAAAKNARLAPTPNVRQTQPGAAKGSNPVHADRRRGMNRNGRTTSDSARFRVTIQHPTIVK